MESVRPKKFVPVGKPTPVPVICKGDDVTAEWLTLMFRFRQWLGPDGTVDEIKTKSIGEGQGEYGDLIAAGVIDPVKVTRSALENAASIAAMLLSTEALVVEKPEEEDDGAGHGHAHHGHAH